MANRRLAFEERITAYEDRLDELCSILEQKSKLGYPPHHTATHELHIKPRDWQHLVLCHKSVRECVRKCEKIRREYDFNCSAGMFKKDRDAIP